MLHWKLERSDDDQNYDSQQYQNRHFIEPAIKDMAAGVFATGEALHWAPHIWW